MFGGAIGESLPIPDLPRDALRNCVDNKLIAKTVGRMNDRRLRKLPFSTERVTLGTRIQ